MYFLQIIATFMDFHVSAVILLVVKKYFVCHCTTVSMGIFALIHTTDTTVFSLFRNLPIDHIFPFFSVRCERAI